MAEWSKAPVSKAGGSERGPQVRILSPPPITEYCPALVEPIAPRARQYSRILAGRRRAARLAQRMVGCLERSKGAALKADVPASNRFAGSNPAPTAIHQQFPADVKGTVDLLSSNLRAGARALCGFESHCPHQIFSTAAHVTGIGRPAPLKTDVTARRRALRVRCPPCAPMHRRMFQTRFSDVG